MICEVLVCFFQHRKIFYPEDCKGCNFYACFSVHIFRVMLHWFVLFLCIYSLLRVLNTPSESWLSWSKLDDVYHKNRIMNMRNENWKRNKTNFVTTGYNFKQATLVYEVIYHKYLNNEVCACDSHKLCLNWLFHLCCMIWCVMSTYIPTSGMVTYHIHTYTTSLMVVSVCCVRLQHRRWDGRAAAETVQSQRGRRSSVWWRQQTHRTAQHTHAGYRSVWLSVICALFAVFFWTKVVIICTKMKVNLLPPADLRSDPKVSGFHPSSLLSIYHILTSVSSALLPFIFC